MKSEHAALARYRIEKAKNTLSDAKLYYPEATSASIVNRIYYSIFYAVSALLICDGHLSSKHSGIRSIFNRHYIKDGLIDIRHGKFYSEMYDARQEGDYSDFKEFQKDVIYTWLEKAEDFINTIDKLINAKIDKK